MFMWICMDIGMDTDALLCTMRKLREGELRKTVDARMAGFAAIGRKGRKEELFSELCFCLLTANYSAEGGIRVQKAVGSGFLALPEKELAKKLKALGYRFPNVRAGFIAQARRHISFLPEVLRMPSMEARLWLVKNVKGLGLKEASHFLRNVGATDLAIIDFHIVDVLERHGMMKKPRGRTLSPKMYIEAEKALRDLAGKLRMNLGELDLYLWFCETGKVLK
ncbi:MAG: N-glycosylase/DNA lyase [Candidatus Aenigmatarchaeota archaeon]